MNLIREPRRWVQETSTDLFHSGAVSFLMFLLATQLKVEGDETDKADLKKFSTENPDGAVVFSIAHHLGHPDSLMVYKTVQKLARPLLTYLQFVSALDTWNDPKSKLFASIIAGEPFLFDRKNLTSATMRSQIATMAKILRPTDGSHARSLAIYPEGTRNPGAEIKEMPVVVAQAAGVSLAVINLLGNGPVMPKVPEGMQSKQVQEILGDRMRTILPPQTFRPRHVVTSELADFIPAGTSRQEMKERFREAHHIT